LLPAEFTADKEKLLRFEQEAFAASRLNHPNILTIYEIGASDGANFIAPNLSKAKPCAIRSNAAI